MYEYKITDSDLDEVNFEYSGKIFRVLKFNNEWSGEYYHLDYNGEGDWYAVGNDYIDYKDAIQSAIKDHFGVK